MGHYGVQETKDALDFMLSSHMAYDLAKADGSVDLADLPLLMAPMMKLLPAIQGLDKVPGELGDLDDAELKEVCDWAKALYKLADDEVEAKVEGALKVFLVVAQYYSSFKKHEEPTPETPTEPSE